MSLIQVALRSRMKGYLRYGDFVLSDFSSSRFYVDLPSLFADDETCQKIADEYGAVVASELPDAIGLLYRSPVSLKTGRLLAQKVDRPSVLFCQMDPSQTSGMPAEGLHTRGFDSTRHRKLAIVGDVIVTGRTFIELSVLLSAAHCHGVFLAILDRRTEHAKVMCEAAHIDIRCLYDWNEFLDEHDKQLEFPAPLDMQRIATQFAVMQREFLFPVGGTHETYNES